MGLLVEGHAHVQFNRRRQIPNGKGCTRDSALLPAAVPQGSCCLAPSLAGGFLSLVRFDPSDDELSKAIPVFPAGFFSHLSAFHLPHGFVPFRVCCPDACLWWAVSNLESPGSCPFAESGIFIVRVSNTLSSQWRRNSVCLEAHASHGPCLSWALCVNWGGAGSPDTLHPRQKSEGAGGNVRQDHPQF